LNDIRIVFLYLFLQPIESQLPVNAKPALLPDSVYQKICNDTVEDAVKNEFLAVCLECDCETIADVRNGVGEASLEEAYDVFCSTRQHTGAPVALVDGETLGRVTNLRNAAAYIAKGLRQSVDDVLQKFSWLDTHGSPAATPSQRVEALEWFEELKTAIDRNTGVAFAISPPVCWLFRSQHGNHNANDDIVNDADCLPCRLGLPDLLNDEQTYETGLDYLCMVVAAAGANNVRTSNFCHSGYLGVRDIWEPGGMIAPIPYGPSACVAKSGLPEILSDAVGYRHIVEPIRIVRT